MSELPHKTVVTDVPTFLLAMAEQLSPQDLRGLLTEGRLNYFSENHQTKWAPLFRVITVAVRTTSLARPMPHIEVLVPSNTPPNLMKTLNRWFLEGRPPVESKDTPWSDDTMAEVAENDRRLYLQELLMPVLLEKVRTGLVERMLVT